jgi:hypothetical protein
MNMVAEAFELFNREYIGFERTLKLIEDDN